MDSRLSYLRRLLLSILPIGGLHLFLASKSKLNLLFAQLISSGHSLIGFEEDFVHNLHIRAIQR